MSAVICTLCCAVNEITTVSIVPQALVKMDTGVVDATVAAFAKPAGPCGPAGP
jgi:hypothetical protein